MPHHEDVYDNETAAEAMRELEKAQRTIRKLRMARGWSYRDAATKLGLTPGRLHTLETCGRQAAFDSLQQYALLLGYRMKITFFTLDDDKECEESVIGPLDSPFDAEGNLKPIFALKPIDQ
ncbi:helix-turn-helix domain-containing protein [Amycolatopsis sp. NPDC003865]